MSRLGTLYGVGVGPGAPDLLTLRAVRVLESADVLALPRSSDFGSSVAWEIVAPVVRAKDSQQHIRLTFPMSKAAADVRPRVEAAVGALGEHLMAGRHPFAERHLGLHSADQRTVPTTLLDHWGELGATWCALDGLLDVARSAPTIATAAVTAERPTSPRCRIGLARDEAFHFYYADNLRRLEAAGAELVPFSPLSAGSLPEVDGLYLGGGYPEAHATALSENLAMRSAIAHFAQQGGPIYAECGGLMYLTEAIVTAEGARHPMVGLLPTEARMCEKLQALGYVEVETQVRTILGGAGSRFRGHQFRYSELSPALSPEAVQHVYSLRRRRAGDTLREGYRVQNVVASYVHAHWASNPRIASELVESCVRYRQERPQ